MLKRSKSDVVDDADTGGDTHRRIFWLDQRDPKPHILTIFSRPTDKAVLI